MGELARVVQAVADGLQNVPGGATLEDVVEATLRDCISAEVIDRETARRIHPWIEGLFRHARPPRPL